LLFLSIFFFFYLELVFKKLSEKIIHTLTINIRNIFHKGDIRLEKNFIIPQSGFDYPNAYPGLTMWFDSSEPGTLSRSGKYAVKFFDKAPGGVVATACEEPPVIIQGKNGEKTKLRFFSKKHRFITPVKQGKYRMFAVIDDTIYIDDINIKCSGHLCYIDVPVASKPFPIECGEVIGYNLEKFNEEYQPKIIDYLTTKWKVKTVIDNTKQEVNEDVTG
jgi:hypothetical protein